MIEVIEDIYNYAARKLEKFSDIDKYSALQKLVRRLQEDADVYYVCLRMEYMLEEDDE